MEEKKKDYLKYITYVSYVALLITLFVILKIAVKITLPLTLSIFLYFMVKPVVTGLEEKKAPNWLAITCAMLTLVLVILIVTWAIFFAVTTLTSSENVNWITSRISQLNVYLEENIDGLKGKNIFSMLGIDYKEKITTIVLSTSSALMSILSSLLLIFIFVLFLLLERQALGKKMLAAFPNVETVRKVKMFKNINTSISRYLLIKTIVSALTGALFYLVCFFTNVKFPFLWGMLAFILNYIPTIGSIVATFGVTIMALIQFFPNWTMIGVIFVVCLLIQNIIGNFIDPKLSGNGLNLSPFIILVSLSLWGYIWGIVGMFLAVPITSTMQIICANIDSLKPIAVFLGTNKTVDNIVKDKVSLRERLKNSLNKD